MRFVSVRYAVAVVLFFKTTTGAISTCSKATTRETTPHCSVHFITNILSSTNYQFFLSEPASSSLSLGRHNSCDVESLEQDAFGINVVVLCCVFLVSEHHHLTETLALIVR